jgi:hypothetical protein
MQIIAICFCFILLTVSSVYAENTITYYRDGSVLQLEAAAAKGVVTVPLPAGIIENSLSVIPFPGTAILDVEMRKLEQGGKSDKAIDELRERKLRLEDRLLALEKREAIFTSAAKTQSGKAPRKTKANPDPMQTIRQGTDFAIAQLESVYTARRKTMQEIHKIDASLVSVGRSVGKSENLVRIVVAPAQGRIRLRYATTERGWQPQYNLDLKGDGTARLQLSAQLSSSMRGFQTRVSMMSLADGLGIESFPARSGSVVLALYNLPVSEDKIMEGVFNGFSGKLTNSTPHYLMSGNLNLLRSGSYLGSFRFEGISSGRSKVISFGRRH